MGASGRGGKKRWLKQRCKGVSVREGEDKAENKNGRKDGIRGNLIWISFLKHQIHFIKIISKFRIFFVLFGNYKNINFDTVLKSRRKKKQKQWLLKNNICLFSPTFRLDLVNKSPRTVAGNPWQICIVWLRNETKIAASVAVRGRDGFLM